MVIGRRVARRKGQHVIALPPEVRDRLGIIPGQWLYWHLGRKGEVVLGTSPARAGGKPPTAHLEAELERALIRVSELETKLQGVWQAAWNEFRAQEVGREVHLRVQGLPALAAINDRLRRIEDLLGTRRGPWVYRVKRGGPVARATQTIPAPILSAPSTSLVPVDGGADSSGAEPPGVPLQT